MKSAALEIEQSLNTALHSIDVEWERKDDGSLAAVDFNQLQVIKVYRMAFERILEVDTSPFTVLLKKIKKVYESTFVHQFEEQFADLQNRILRLEGQNTKLEKEKRSMARRIEALQLETRNLQRTIDAKDAALSSLSQQSGLSSMELQRIISLGREESDPRTRDVASIKTHAKRMWEKVGGAVPVADSPPTSEDSELSSGEESLVEGAGYTMDKVVRIVKHLKRWKQRALDAEGERSALQLTKSPTTGLAAELRELSRSLSPSPSRLRPQPSDMSNVSSPSPSRRQSSAKTYNWLKRVDFDSIHQQQLVQQLEDG
eukprot:Sspe_Gene.78237::Locus_48943_Transcript_1_1_Confidence_1.000_Length_1229::g.78237::m.78237